MIGKKIKILTAGRSFPNLELPPAVKEILDRNPKNVGNEIKFFMDGGWLYIIISASGDLVKIGAAFSMLYDRFNTNVRSRWQTWELHGGKFAIGIRVLYPAQTENIIHKCMGKSRNLGPPVIGNEVFNFNERLDIVIMLLNDCKQSVTTREILRKKPGYNNVVKRDKRPADFEGMKFRSDSDTRFPPMIEYDEVKGCDDNHVALLFCENCEEPDGGTFTLDQSIQIVQSLQTCVLNEGSFRAGFDKFFGGSESHFRKLLHGPTAIARSIDIVETEPKLEWFLINPYAVGPLAARGGAGGGGSGPATGGGNPGGGPGGGGGDYPGDDLGGYPRPDDNAGFDNYRDETSATASSSWTYDEQVVATEAEMQLQEVLLASSASSTSEGTPLSSRYSSSAANTIPPSVDKRQSAALAAEQRLLASNRADTESSKTSHANKKTKANDGSSIKSSLSSFDGASRKSSLLSSTDKDSSSSAFGVSAVKTVPPFLVSLHSMLCDKSHSDIISWNVGGIIIHKRQDLEKFVLGKYYNHSKFASFTHQLNRYGFENDGGIINACSFTHKTLTDDVESVLSLQTLVAKAKSKEIVKIDSDSEGEEKSISDSQDSESISDDVQAAVRERNKISAAAVRERNKISAAAVRERNKISARISRMRKRKYIKGLEEELAEYKKKEMGGNDVLSTDDTAGDERPVLNASAEERRKQSLSAAEKRRELSTASAVKPATSDASLDDVGTSTKSKDVIEIDSDSEGEGEKKSAAVKDSPASTSDASLGEDDERSSGDESAAKRLKRVSATEPAAAKDGDSAGIVSKYSAAKDCDNNELPNDDTTPPASSSRVTSNPTSTTADNHDVSNVPAFLVSLHSMLCEKSLSSIISWNVSQGVGEIIIHQREVLEKSVLGKYYNHSKFASFTRQLNRYGFKNGFVDRIDGIITACSYTHETLTNDVESVLKIVVIRTFVSTDDVGTDNVAVKDSSSSSLHAKAQAELRAAFLSAAAVGSVPKEKPTNPVVKDSSLQPNLGSSVESKQSPEELTLFKFLESQQDCITGSAAKFGAWIKSQGIDSMTDLKDAVGNNSYLNKMVDGKGGNALKFFKCDAFKLAVSEFEASLSTLSTTPPSLSVAQPTQTCNKSNVTTNQLKTPQTLRLPQVRTGINNDLAKLTNNQVVAMNPQFNNRAVLPLPLHMFQPMGSQMVASTLLPSYQPQFSNQGRPMPLGRFNLHSLLPMQQGVNWQALQMKASTAEDTSNLCVRETTDAAKVTTDNQATSAGVDETPPSKPTSRPSISRVAAPSVSFRSPWFTLSESEFLSLSNARASTACVESQDAGVDATIAARANNQATESTLTSSTNVLSTSKDEDVELLGDE